jgi:hypothetical protein
MFFECTISLGRSRLQITNRQAARSAPDSHDTSNAASTQDVPVGIRRHRSLRSLIFKRFSGENYIELPAPAGVSELHGSDPVFELDGSHESIPSCPTAIQSECAVASTTNSPSHVSPRACDVPVAHEPERITLTIPVESYPMADTGHDISNNQPAIMRRVVSLPSDDILLNFISAVHPQRVISAPSASSIKEDQSSPVPLPWALNGVSIFYAATSERFIINTDGQGVKQLITALEIRPTSVCNVSRSTSLRDLTRLRTTIRTYTVKLSPKLLQDLPFVNLIRSVSLEDANFYQSDQNLHDIRYIMKSKDKQQHYFRAGKLSFSSRNSVIHRAYPPLKCDQCTRVFTGQHRRRIFAGHRKRIHGHATSKVEDHSTPQLSDCQNRRSNTRCSRLSRQSTKRMSKPGNPGSKNFEHRNRSLKRHSLRDHGCKL